MTQDSKKVVYFVRHGQSVDNAAPVFQSVGTPLSDVGLQQAGLIADRLAQVQFEALISSPYPRAKQTAAAIAKTTKKTAEFSDLFVERGKPTSVDGKPWDDPEANALWHQWHQTLYTPGARILDGENYDDLIARADAALDYLHNRPEQSMVVVTHGYFLRTLVARVLLGDSLTGHLLERFQTRASVQNTAITVMHYKDAFEEDACWRLWTLNDHAHFAD